MASKPQTADVPTLSIPEIRDYQRINAELTGLLDLGHRHVRLAGAEGQRLLVSGLTGPWDATVEVVGRIGPELALGLNAPNLIVVARGRAADGAGSRLRAGLLTILGHSGPAVGYAMSGGAVVAADDVGPRAGLNQSGGDLILLRRAGPLAGERQSGGRLFVVPSLLGPHAGRGRLGGEMLDMNEPGSAFVETLERVKGWMGFALDPSEAGPKSERP